MRDLGKAIRGTLQNMIPGVSNVHLDYIFTNQEEGQPRSTILESKSPFWSSKYPVMYVLFVNTKYEYGTKDFNTDAPAEGVSYSVHLGINKELTMSVLEKYPQYKDKILGLVDKMSIGKYSSIDIVYEDESRSLYDASLKALESIKYFESMIDDSGGEDDGDEREREPWFPGDSSADWEFEQEEGALVPIRSPTNLYL